MSALTICALLLCLYLTPYFEEANSKTSTYYVSEDGHCNQSHKYVPCQPLMWFVNNSRSISNDSMIIFLPGRHSLNSSEYKSSLLAFNNKENLTLSGIDNNSVVVCRGPNSGLFLQNSSTININNLAFQGCKANTANGQYGGVFFKYSNDITISRVLINDCKGYGLHIADSYGHIRIENSHFSGNMDGNGVFWFKHCRNNHSQLTFLSISDSSFCNGTTHKENATGLNLKLLCSGVHVTLANLKLKNNRGISGGNIAVHIIDFAIDTSTVTIEDCTIEDGSSHRDGGGMKMWFEKKLKDDMNGYNCSRVLILVAKNTTFKGNRANTSGGGVLVEYHESPGTGCTIRQVEFIDCKFIENSALRASAIEITKHQVPRYLVHNTPQFSVALNFSVITNNTLLSREEQSNKEGTIEVLSVEKFIINNSSLINNNGTALMLVNSGVQFFNKIVFANNSAYYGGAIKLCESSVMYFNNDTRVQFLSNKAKNAGGAIYSGNQCLQEAPPCFFQIFLENSSNIPAIKNLAKGIFYFEENHAGIAGHAIYGGSVNSCFTDMQLGITNNTQNISYFNSFNLYKRVFKFSENRTSLVTSDPYGVCQCSSITNTSIHLNCAQRTITRKGYPGEYLIFYISAVGQTKGSVPSQISVEAADKDKESFKMNRKDKYSTQTLNSIPFCQKIVVEIRPGKDVNKVSLKVGILQVNSISESSHYYELKKLTVNVTINLHCPQLFKLNNSSNYSTCDCQYSNLEMSCDINTKTVTIKRSNHTESDITWIGLINASHNTSYIAASTKCQKHRCDQNKSTFNEYNLSEICVEGREGRICGKCKSSYTLSLGPLNCIKSEYCFITKTLFLLVVFFLAGILLVCFLAVLNLTVTEGTINGLLFYANCIHANQNLLYESNKPIIYFIAWLNLDFGIEVCFYSRMTAYQKFWLEFGFLFYLFLLGVLIVCLSRKFIWFTRLTGRNIVPVLSTMILLAYPKVVRNCIKIWNCHKDKYWSTDNSTPWIWHSDETIDCFTGKHLPLFILSVILFIAAFLYTLCLLFIQCLQRGSSWYVLRWVNRLRPFFDANTGPCRNHYQFWPGFLLFARLGLYLVFWRITDTSHRLYVLLALCTLIFFLACVSPKGVYKKWPINLLEFCFFFNVAIGAGSVAIIKSDQAERKEALSDTSIAIALFISLLILIYHIYKKLRETKRWKSMIKRLQKRRIKLRRTNEPSDVESSQMEDTPLIQNQGQPRVITFNALRESLLEDN